MKTLVVYGAIIALTLAAVDLICIGFNLFPPGYNYGDPELGWRPARASGRMTSERCIEYSTGEEVSYARNEDGVRTAVSRADQLDTAGVRIAVTGDSQTDLCASNEQTHPGILERSLRADGIAASVLAYGAGRYSPLQDYLAYRTVLRPYHPDVLLINLYTGNDFYDLLRSDDRPHFESSPAGYRIAPPVWFQYDAPGFRRRSRVLFLFRTMAEKTGLRQLMIRGRQLRLLAAEQHRGFSAVTGYMWDLWKANARSLGYPAAFSAQMLNQNLFFRHFPESRTESLRRLQYLMRKVRAENPGVILVMSPLPSYLLLHPAPLDSALISTLARLGIPVEEAIAQEHGLYEDTRALARNEGWLFVDNLAALDALHRPDLFNRFDYHYLPPASAVIGRAQAQVLMPLLQTHPSPTGGAGP